jgi:uncharacterized membrane protein
MKRSVISMILGFLFTFPIAFLIGIINPIKTITSEMTIWANPTLVDIGVALATGLIGAYAMARKDIPEALAGVAVASAFTPPVCTLALALAYNNLPLARGAGLLFAVNMVSITLAAWAVFVWLGMHPQIGEESRPRQYAWTALVLAFVAVLGIFLLREVNPSTYEAGVEQALRAAFLQDALVDFEVNRSDPVQVIATIRRESDRLDDNSEVIAAQEALQMALEQAVDLDVIIQLIYDPPMPTLAPTAETP